jgi:hypothetical protein
MNLPYNFNRDRVNVEMLFQIMVNTKAQMQRMLSFILAKFSLDFPPLKIIVSMSFHQCHPGD